MQHAESRKHLQGVIELRTMPASRRKSSNFQGADYNLDVDTTHWRKERCKSGIRSRVVFDHGDNRIDEAYIIFVDRLLGPSDLEMEQDEDDSTYAAFLENLKECGNSYILGVSLEHGVFFPLKYESENDSPDEPKRGTSRSCSGSLIQKSRSLGVDGDLEGDMKKICLNVDTLIRKRGRSAIDVVLKSGAKHSGSGKENTQMNAQKKNPVSKPSEGAGYSSGQDPKSNSMADTVKDSYGVFISHLKRKGKSVFYEYGDGKQVIYEESDQQKSTDVKNGSSKTVYTGQIPHSRPPVPARTPSQTTSIVGAPTPARPHTSRSLTAEDRHKVANIPSKTAFRTQIPSRPLTQSPTPRAPALTSTCTPRPSLGCSSGQDHRSNRRAAASNGSCMVFICGLEANRESYYKYGDGKQLYYKEEYQQKSTHVENKPLETPITMQIPLLRPPIQSPTSNQTASTPPTTCAPPTKSLTAKCYHDVQNKPSEVVCEAQILISRPPNRSPFQPAPTPPLAPRASTSSLTPITETSIVTNRCDMFAECVSFLFGLVQLHLFKNGAELFDLHRVRRSRTKGVVQSGDSGHVLGSLKS